MSTMERHYYTFTASNGTQVTVLRGDGPPTIVSGGSRWGIVEVPRRVSFSQWQGRDLYALDIPILFDAFIDRGSVEPDIVKLLQMAKSESFDPPPSVTIEGGLPVDVVKWVITGITWGSEVYWSRVPKGAYYRTRQDAVVHVLEVHRAPRVKILATSTLPHFYTVQKGRTVTLRQVSKETYGDATQWKRIKKANPSVRDPNKVTGPKRLRIP